MDPNKRDLRAYVRYDGRGRIIPGSLILRRSKPKVGNWKEVSAYECCGPTPVAGDPVDPTTTTTTTVAPSTTTSTTAAPTTTTSTTVAPTTTTTTTIP